jgi:hypothetical protein
MCRVTKQALKALASEEDIADIVNLFNECFNPSAGDTTQLTTQATTIPFDFGANSEGADPGTEVEATMAPELLSQRLGFRSNIPLLFNTHKHSGGITPWDSPKLFENIEDNEALTPNELHWHQLSGIHGILRRLLSQSPSHARPGVLVADEVGLGKTLQSLGILSWLAECVGRQKIGRTLPPILSEWSDIVFLIALTYSQRSAHTSARARSSLITVI